MTTNALASTQSSSVVPSSGWTLKQIVIGATVSVISWGAVRSVGKMVSWKLALRDAKTGGPAPGPSPLPLLGNTLDLRVAYYETLYRYVDQPASVFWVTSNPFVVVNEEEGLRRVLGGANGLYTKPKYFGYRSSTLSKAVASQRERVADESIEYDDDGDTSRVALQQLISEAFPKIKKQVHTLLRGIETDPLDEDVVHAVRRAIVALNLDILFGAHVGADGEDPSRISDMIDFAGTEFARRMVNPFKIIIDIPNNIRFLRDVTALMRLGARLSHSLDKAAITSDSPAAGVSWVHAWIGKVGVIGKLGKVVGLLMASTQTVPITAVWLLHIVGNDDRVCANVRNELDKHDIRSIQDLDFEHLDSLVYVDAVVKEVLRLYPPFPLIQRQVQQNDILAGITVPAQTIVYVVPWLIHRNDRYWKDPHVFQPERFLNGSQSHGDAPSDWVYLPFGRGPRMCAGSKLALTELKILLIHSVLGFTWTSWQVGKEKRDERFPELGMVPRDIKLKVTSDEKTKALDSSLLVHNSL